MANEQASLPVKARVPVSIWRMMQPRQLLRQEAAEVVDHEAKAEAGAPEAVSGNAKTAATATKRTIAKSTRRKSP